jgi:hypothetical protein
MVTNDSPYGCTFYTFDQIHGTLPAQLLPDMKSLRLTWLRYQLPWQFLEQHQGTDIWTVVDTVVERCHRHTINICYVIQQSPRFYDQQPGCNTRAIISDGTASSTSVVLNTTPTALPANTPVRFSGGTGNPEIIVVSPYYAQGANPVSHAQPIMGNNRTTMQWYLYPDPHSTKVFAQAIATHSNGQNGYGTIQALEIGNEEYDGQNPNGSSSNAYNDRATTYSITVLLVVAPAIRTAHLTAIIGMCAIWWNQPPHASNFLSAIYQASPTMKNNFDDVNAHSSPFESGSSDMVDIDRWCHVAQPQSTVPSFPQEWQALHAVMNANGDESKAIRVTEFGWYTTNQQAGRGTINHVSQDIQARNYFSFFESTRLSGDVFPPFLPIQRWVQRWPKKHAIRTRRLRKMDRLKATRVLLRPCMLLTHRGFSPMVEEIGPKPSTAQRILSVIIVFQSRFLLLTTPFGSHRSLLPCASDAVATCRLKRENESILERYL